MNEGDVKVVRIQVAIRLPQGLVTLLDAAAKADAEEGFAPSRSRTLAKVLPGALRPLVEQHEGEDAR